MRHDVLVIAEAGVNHNGSLELALRLVDAAAAAGADMVKFQTFKADNLASTQAPKAAYQKRRTEADESQHAMLKALELDLEAHHRLAAACAAQGITFLSSAFDHDSLALLVDDMGLKSVKFGSGELTNAPLLYDAARRGCEVLLSTGMSGLGDIEQALQVLALGYADAPPQHPSVEDFAAAWGDPLLRQRLREKVILFHCTSQYPAPLKSVNLKAMNTIAAAFGVRAGYSDHTVGTVVCCGAAALGAVAVEKHFTLDRTLPGPDHASSLEPDELRRMISDIRQIEACLGEPVKHVVACEADTARVARKSLVAAADIAAGEPFSEANLTVKRPGTGMAPDKYWSLLGRPASAAYRRDDLIKELP